MWCTCTGGGKRGFTRLNESDLWGCASCLKPTRMVFEKVTSMYAPSGAKAFAAVFGRADGVNELRWVTDSGIKTTLHYSPYPWKVGMNQGRALLLEVWKKLDEVTAQVMDKSDPSVDDTYAKAQARAFAEILVLFMQPFFDSADDIVREAVARYKDHTAGVEHETPGLAERLWSPYTRWDGTPFSDESLEAVESGKKPRASVKRTGNKIPEASVNSSRDAIKLGMFTVAQIAKAYSMTDAEVKEQLGLV